MKAEVSRSCEKIDFGIIARMLKLTRGSTVAAIYRAATVRERRVASLI